MRNYWLELDKANNTIGCMHPLSGAKVHYVHKSKFVTDGFMCFGCVECGGVVGMRNVFGWINLTKAERKAQCPHCQQKISKDEWDTVFADWLGTSLYIV
jgi:DNA-directed RNA polymerase subunit RPC12/RpoP